ncbi:hypothetical protein GOODEAATRI_025478 [Goodea atripinnis]|uniref:Rho-GAP domain-containing protein n=1 Tax=Goodea atripinnis TaxID=208336 RepID=A0ABV0PH40_9TELE
MLKTRQGCEYLMQYDTESIISDWCKVIQDTIHHLTPHQPVQQHTLESNSCQQRTCESPGKCSQSFSWSLPAAAEDHHLIITQFITLKVVLLTLWFCVLAEEHLDLEDGQWEEIHVIAGALKFFFRELPEPLFPFSSFEKFIATIHHSQRVSYMKDLVRSLPLPNYDTMKLLFKHLRRVIEHKESNRMSVQSIAIVFGPTLLRPQIESANMTVHMVFQSQIVELMLNKFKDIFSIEGAPLSPSRTF